MHAPYWTQIQLDHVLHDLVPDIHVARLNECREKVVNLEGIVSGHCKP